MDEKERARVETRVCNVVAASACVERFTVTSATRLIEDAGMADSLDRVELCMDLEDEFNVVLDDREVMNALTVQQCVELVVEKLQAQAEKVRREQRMVEAQVNQPFGGVL
ncbi:hypothetical protein RD110_15765 [Rhodoferax koreense]|uniref:Carrier domain-containing protein n=1 Tax=Rhodoferax koreensis TaxID=1842727 RepID=A0A1P8JXK7_9BURK|nr:phosphopantetheine-binding protein [Rhodoferax koreense]APW38478.1 hypothetical protein RD110_15765 [Rhodoferax koreense]